MRLRIRILLFLVVLVPVGFYTKIYSGPGSVWVRDYAGGVLYEVFWCLVLLWLMPGTRPCRIAVGVFGVTSLLEVLQLWHPPFLEALRSSFLGQAVLGTSFDTWDFVFYGIGCALGWLWMKRLKGGDDEISKTGEDGY
ncbi:MAG: DUF2809 domain-containing protein [bacterium]|nr:DUF2809 domain-containing protein [bacterium]